MECMDCPNAERPLHRVSWAVGQGMMNEIRHNRGCMHWKKCKVRDKER